MSTLVVNPWFKFGGKKPCPCESGKRFKRCHLKDQPEFVPEDVAAKSLLLMRMLEHAESVEIVKAK